MKKPIKSLINIISRKNTAGEIYFQARFFDKSGCLIKSISFPDIKSRSEAYLKAREKAEEVLPPSLTSDEIKLHGILSIDEVRKLLDLPENNPMKARDALIALLGITCGLSVTEIRCLERKHLTVNNCIQIESGHESRVIPIIRKVKARIEKIKEHFPESRYVIPNLRHKDKPCDSSGINRGIESVVSLIGIKSERYIVPSVLRDTFITLLKRCNKDIDIKIIDYLCGFNYSEIETTKITKVIGNMMIELEKDYDGGVKTHKFWTDSLF